MPFFVVAHIDSITPPTIMNPFLAINLVLAFSGVTSIIFAMPAIDPDPAGIVTKPVPEKTVVLSFDDGVVSHATIVAPILKRLGFNASFYISDFDGFKTRKDWYMTWEQIKSLADQGFDVGNHTRGHGGASMGPYLEMEAQFSEHHLPKPTTLAWPVYSVFKQLYPELIANHYTFGRAGGGRPYRPTVDHPLNVPSWGVQDNISVETFISDAKQATGGRIAVFTFHGVPEGEHPPVSLDPAKFAQMMQYLKDNRYNVISLQEMADYVDVEKAGRVLPFPNTFSWGGMRREGNQLYVFIRKIPTDRKLTLSGITTQVTNARYAADPDKHSLKIIAADTGIQTIELPQSPFEPSNDFPAVIVADLKGDPIATLIGFGIPGAPSATISGNSIRLTVPLATDLTKLAPTYDTGSLNVTGKPASGAVTDFTNPQSYTITKANGPSRRYLVTVIPTAGAVAITNSSFEDLKRTGNSDEDIEMKPSGAPWTFINHGGEIGIQDLVGVGGAPPPPDGSRHAVYMRGPGNGISQTFTFDPGNYTISFDVVKRSGYEKTAAPLKITLDGTPVFTVDSSAITEAWSSKTSPAFPVTAGVHTLAFILGDGEGMDMIDNLAIHYRK